MVKRISIQPIPERMERLVRLKCPKSQRRGAPFHILDERKLPGTSAWLLYKSKQAGSSIVTLTQRTGRGRWLERAEEKTAGEVQVP